MTILPPARAATVFYALQIRTMQEYIRKRHWEMVMCVEDTASGVSDRKKRNSILHAARKREIDVIVVWKLYRWGRSLVDLMNSLQELTVLHVGFVSITEAFWKSYGWDVSCVCRV